MRTHDYILKSSKIPALYSQSEKGSDAIVHVKLFTPDSNWTWYLTEYDPADRLAFGLCVFFVEAEMGYVSLAELETVRGPMGLRVERDLYWTPRPLREVAEYPIHA
jgi:hypothetical protein